MFFKLRIQARTCIALAATIVCPGQLILSSACGGGEGDEREACLYYVDARNEAYSECGLEDGLVEADAVCPRGPTTRVDGVDCSAYYRQLGDSFACVDAGVVWNPNVVCQ